MAREDLIEKYVGLGYLTQVAGGKVFWPTNRGAEVLEERKLLLRWLAMDLLPPPKVAQTLRAIDDLTKLDPVERFVLFDKWIEQMWRTAEGWKVYEKVWREAFAAGLVPTEEAPPR